MVFLFCEIHSSAHLTFIHFYFWSFTIHFLSTLDTQNHLRPILVLLEEMRYTHHISTGTSIYTYTRVPPASICFRILFEYNSKEYVLQTTLICKSWHNHTEKFDEFQPTVHGRQMCHCNNFKENQGNWLEWVWAS